MMRRWWGRGRGSSGRGVFVGILDKAEEVELYSVLGLDIDMC